MICLSVPVSQPYGLDMIPCTEYIYTVLCLRRANGLGVAFTAHALKSVYCLYGTVSKADQISMLGDTSMLALKLTKYR
jgi:hypothetical protein